MKLVVLTPGVGTKSGWATFSKAVVQRLRDRYEVEVVDDLAPPIEMKQNPVSILQAAVTVRRRLDEAAAVFSLVSHPYSGVAMLATLGRQTPYFVSCHGTYAVRPLYNEHRFLARPALKRAAKVFPVSTFTADRIRDRLPAIDNITVVPNGVDPEVEDVRPFEVDHRVLLTVGSFKPRKGQDNAVRAFGNVADDLPDVHLHLVGGGEDSEYADRVRRIARDHSIEDRVHFEGRVSDDALRRWYATADLFVLASNYVDHSFEGFPLVFLEANKYGVPAVGNEGTSARDAIDHGRSGLVAENDAESIGVAVKSILQNPKRREQFSRGARSWAEEHSWDRTVQAFCEAIDETVDDNGARRPPRETDTQQA